MNKARAAARLWFYRTGYRWLYDASYSLDTWLHMHRLHVRTLCDLHDVLSGMPWRQVWRERLSGSKPHKAMNNFLSFLNHPSQQKETP